MGDHIVHRVKLNVQVPELQLSFKVQQQLKEYLAGSLQYKIGKLLDTYDTGDEVLVLDNLHLDIGTISKEHIEKEFEEKLLSSLRTQLDKHLPASQPGMATDTNLRYNAGRYGMQKEGTDDDSKKQSSQTDGEATTVASRGEQEVVLWPPSDAKQSEPPPSPSGTVDVKDKPVADNGITTKASSGEAAQQPGEPLPQPGETGLQQQTTPGKEAVNLLPQDSPAGAGTAPSEEQDTNPFHQAPPVENQINKEVLSKDAAPTGAIQESPGKEVIKETADGEKEAGTGSATTMPGAIPSGKDMGAALAGQKNTGDDIETAIIRPGVSSGNIETGNTRNESDTSNASDASGTAISARVVDGGSNGDAGNGIAGEDVLKSGSLPGDEAGDRSLPPNDAAQTGKAWNNTTEPNTGASLVKGDRRILEAFLVFLQTGTMPWWAPRFDMEEWEELMLKNLPGHASWIKEAWLRLMNGNNKALFRWVLQFSARYKKRFLYLLFPGLEDVLKARLSALHAPAAAADATLPDMVFRYHPLLATVFLQSATDKEWEMAFWQAIAGILPAASSADIGSGLIDQLETLLANTLAPQADTSEVKSTLSAIARQLQSGVIPGSKQAPASVNQYLSVPFRTFTQKANTAEYFIGNAGLVILHPFIKILFSKLNILSEEGMLEDHAKYKAVHVLQYLASGHSHTPEFSLVLNKILCGIPPDDPVDIEVVLNETEKDECDQLLQVVISYWEILKNTTTDGLRGNYLLRDAKLSLQEDRWLMQVEQKTMDILMSRLPWGISMVKFPWMDLLLVVEWT
jgi:Contractile injection system tape measure protein